MGELNSFKDLKAWKSSQELRVLISDLTKTFPKEEKFRLTDQIIRASRSVSNNIAEGYGRFHYKENIQFCRIGRGSLYEVIDHLLIAEEEKYIDKNKLKELETLIDKCLALTNGYIKYLKSQLTINK